MVSRTLLVVVFAGMAGIALAQSPSLPNNPMSGYGSPGFPGGGNQTWSGPNRNINSLVGSVQSADNQPLDNVRVELRDNATGVVVGYSYTGMGGSFEFNQLPQGSYEVVALSGAQKAEERVQVNSMNTNVQLRLPMVRPRDGMGNGTVSVSQFRIPDAARNELRKAQEASARNKHDDALKHLNRALEIQPNFAEALTARATYKLDEQDLDGAINDLQHAVQSDANCALAYTVLGSVFNMQSKFDEALRSLQRAETLAPDVWQTHFELGRSYAGKGDYAASLKSLDRAEKLVPRDFPLLHLVRANDQLGLGQFAQAANELQSFIQKNPASPHIDQAKKMLEQAQAGMETAQK